MESLLLNACLAGKFGHVYGYDGGAVLEAGFVYLSGRVDETWLNALSEKWKYRMFVCLSRDWENALLAKYPDMIKTVRTQMHAEMRDLDAEKLCTFAENVPNDVRIVRFDEAVFAKKPFGHGENYASFADFAARGAGAAALCGDEVVSACSSFLTLDNAVEVDISTLPEYRRMGIGIACAARMLLECLEKDFAPHWDAQNDASRRMAQKLGYAVAYEYNAYSFVRPNEP